MWNEENRDWSSATKEELIILKYCEETKENVWQVVQGGCSWYCGGSVDSITSSSTLSSKENKY